MRKTRVALIQIGPHLDCEDLIQIGVAANALLEVWLEGQEGGFDSVENVHFSHIEIRLIVGYA